MSESDPNLEGVLSISSDKLVQARDAMGLTQEAIQRDLRFTSKVVKAIESGDLSGMGQPVFARGYIRSYCKRVGLDADPFIAEYDAVLGDTTPKRQSRMRNTGSMNPKRASVVSEKSGSRLLSGVLKLVLLLAVLVGGYFAVEESGVDLSSFNLDSLIGGKSETAPRVDENSLIIPGVAKEDGAGLSLPMPVVEDAAEPNAIGDEPTIETVITTANESASVDTPDETPVETLVSPAETQVAPVEAQVTPVETPTEEAASPAIVEEVQESEPQVVAEPEPAASEPPTEGIARLQIAFSDVSWINIKDASGDPLFNGLAERGRTLELSGAPPISIVIGRADAVQTLSFNGSMVDLEPHTRKNVARLSLPR